MVNFKIVFVVSLFILFIGVFAINVISLSSSKNEKINLVIDTDAGGDDALAILLLLSAEKKLQKQFEIVAITCVYGNTEEKIVELNVRKTLTIAKRNDIKVYAGAQKPLIRNQTSDNFFGNDGFGDFEFNQIITAQVDYSKHAAVALVELAQKYKDNLSILALGPLTNIAMAHNLDPQFASNVNTFYVMGGSVHGRGNAAPGVEFNFHADPVSNFILFNSVKRTGAIVLTPWETVFNAHITKKWRREILGGLNSTSIKFLNKVDGCLLKTETDWFPADAMAATIILWRHLVTEEMLVNVRAVMFGVAEGSILIDYNNNTNEIQNTRIIDSIDKAEFLNILINYMQEDM